MEELIQSVIESLKPTRPNGAFTTKEFHAELNKHNPCSIKRVLGILRALKEQGKIEVVVIPTQDILDRNTTVRGWKLTKS